MFFQRFYDPRLAQASYLIGCQSKGTAIVVDPARAVGQYLAAAAAEGLRIEAVTETHIHADFVSGLRELAAAAGARMYLSGCGTADWQYGFRSDPNVTLLADRDRIELGRVVLTAIHTPGHTPEHLSFLVTDGAASSEPMGIITGDFVFVGDVGRPDLLEKAAGITGTAETAARQQWASLGWFKTLGDHLQVWPGHGAGSACGKGLGAMPQSTIGYERHTNWALGVLSEPEFVKQVLAGQPEPPRYFGRMKRVNRDGPPILGERPAPPRLSGDGLPSALAAGVVVDLRSTAEFAARHVPGTLNLPMGKNFPTYAGSLLPYDRPLYFITQTPTEAALDDLATSLASVGFDRIAGVFDTGALDAWQAAGKALGSTPQLSPAELGSTAKRRYLLDVRNRSEWDEGRLAGAHLIPLPELIDRLTEIPAGSDIVVHCQGGGRASVAASVLKGAGHREVANLAGGLAGWIAAGGPVER
jgi:hydroxyacylglutathione hydrolase